ncbi:EthD family reductase [Pseudomonas sp. RIT-PI-S]|uniref:EthD family reductase n=1 Tax=Pseudomonas sp. RIT-PI-S TaxID=3035295 RepID=UPI0021D8A949|nr:EthD family reductase [Pseudomonas sp. RIT-PI-S]
MIKVCVLYPNAEGVTFDYPYYLDKHMALVRLRLGASLIADSVEKGLGGGAPQSAAPFVTICSLYFETLESFKQAMGAHGAELNADVPHFTNATPLTQISEVLVERPAR